MVLARRYGKPGGLCWIVVIKDCDLSVSGESDAEIHCTERLSAKVGGGSDVMYTSDNAAQITAALWQYAGS